MKALNVNLDVAFAQLPTTEPVAAGSAWRNPSTGVIYLGVGIPPVFSDHPDAVTIDEEQNATFTVASNNTTSRQWYSSTDNVNWTIIVGETGLTYTITAATHGDHDAHYYRCTAVGPGGTTNSNSALLTVYALAPLTGLTASVAISPQYLDAAWQFSQRATVRVQKAYTGVFTDLYPHSTGELFTSPGGAGSSATTWAAGSRLIVDIPYNQALASEVASGHPTPVTDTSRCLQLDISIPTCPSFAGIEQGTQDAGQHATERGYDLNVSVATTNPFLGVSIDEYPATLNTDYRPWQNNTGTTHNLLVNTASRRYYPTPGLCVSTNPGSTTGLRLPTVRTVLHESIGNRSNYRGVFTLDGGVVVASNVTNVAESATSTPMRWAGVTNPLTGRAYGLVFITGAYKTVADLRYNGTISKRLHGVCHRRYAASELRVCSPVQYKTTPINLTTGLGAMRIVATSGANRALEASWNGGAYAAIGTTDGYGHLVGTLPGCSVGSGSLMVRVVGQTANVVTVSDVRVGVVIARAGQSNADERGDDITLTSTRTIAAGAISNSTATKKSWIWNRLQQMATQYSSPLQMDGWSAGATLLCYDTGGTTDGSHGHWHPRNTGISTTNAFIEFVGNCNVADDEPNYVIYHQGEEDAAALGGTPTAKYKAAMAELVTEFRTRTGWSTVPFYVMSLGRDGVVNDANVDKIRYAQQQGWDDGTTSAGGCLAHINLIGDAALVHFWTQDEKDQVAAIFKRHSVAGGGGRAHRYSSGSKGTTTITLNFTGGSGDLVPGASPTIGWTCTDGGGALTVSSVSVTASQIILTVNRTISGSVLTKWCSHYSGVGSTIRDSDAVTPLPPEPFEVTL